MLWSVWRDRTGDRLLIGASGPLYLMLALTAGYCLGLALLGNTPLKTLQPFIGQSWPWSNLAVLERFYSTLGTMTVSLTQSPYCDGGYSWGFRTVTGHCGSLGMFVRTYGLAPVVVTFVLGWWVTRQPRIEADDSRTTFLWGILGSLLALPVFFILFDFVAGVDSPEEWQRSLSIWLRSRLVEPWFYGGILIGLALFLREAGARERRWVQSAMLMCIAFYGLTSLVFPAQFVANAGYLIDVLMRR